MEGKKQGGKGRRNVTILSLVIQGTKRFFAVHQEEYKNTKDLPKAPTH